MRFAAKIEHWRAFALGFFVAYLVAPDAIAQGATLPPIDPETAAVLQKIDAKWQDRLLSCLSPEAKSGKAPKSCDNLIDDVARAALRQPLVHAHIFGRVEVPVWLRAAGARRAEPAAKLNDALRSGLPAQWQEMLTVLPVEAQYLLATLSRTDLNPQQAELTAQLVQTRLGVGLCFTAPWLKAHEKPTCASVCRSWLQAFAALPLAKWQAWNQSQMRANLRSKDWALRYAGAKAFLAMGLDPNTDADLLRLQRDLAIDPQISQAILSAFGQSLPTFSLRTALYPPHDPHADWSWAMVPLAQGSQVPSPVPMAPSLKPPAVPLAEVPKFAKLQLRLDRTESQCFDAFEGHDGPNKGAAWCHAETSQIPLDASPILSAHLLGMNLLRGDDPPDLVRGYTVPKSLEVVQNLSEQADLQVLQAYVAYGLQQHLALLATRKQDDWHDTLQKLLGWALRVGDITVCDAEIPAAAACVQRTVDWLDAISLLANDDCAVRIAQELAARLRADDAKVVALALHNLLEDVRLRIGARSKLDAVESLRQLAPWVQRNWLLKKDLSPQDAALVDKKLSPFLAHSVLYPQKQPRDLLQPSELAQLRAVDLTKPPPPQQELMK